MYTTESIISLTDNEGEAIFTAFTQAELLKDIYSSIFGENGARPMATLPVPTVVMPAPLFSIPVVHRELSRLDISEGAGPDDIHTQMVRCLAEFWPNEGKCLPYIHYFILQWLFSHNDREPEEAPIWSYSAQQFGF